LVAHACNPGYLGSWDQEDCGQASPGKQCMRPYLQKNQSNMG
jgi:hypothetical protein